MLNASASAIRFGPFTLDLKTGEVRKDGVRVKLAPQPSKVLLFLVQQAGQIVTREELREHIWSHETFVDFDKALNFSIKQIRAALHDDADRPTYIETLPRRGYRFIARVENTKLGNSQSGGKHRPIDNEQKVGRHKAMRIAALAMLGGLGAALLLAVIFRPRVPSIRSVAVLPFRNLSGEAGQDFFADGVTYSLTTELGQIRRLRVISFTSAMKYKGTPKSLAEIANELKVDAIVQGAVLRSGNDVNISMQLIDVRTERQLWAREYKGEIANTIAEAGQSALQIARVIPLGLTRQEELHLSHPETLSRPAHEAYLKGRLLWAKFSSASWQRAAEYFTQAIELDANYASAYVGLADCNLLLASYGAVPAHDGMTKAKASIAKALALDSSLGEAHFSLAFLQAFYEYDWAGAQVEFQRGLDLSPNYAIGDMWYGTYLLVLGRREQAIAEAKKALRLDPMSLVINTNLGRAYYLSNQADAAIIQLQAALKLDPDYPLAHFWLSEAYMVKGMLREGVNERKAAFGAFGDQDLADNLERVFDTEGYPGVLRWDLKKALGEIKGGREEQVDVALAYAALGDRHAAFEWLERAYALRSPDLALIKLWPGFESLRSDPRYKDLLQRMRLPG